MCELAARPALNALHGPRHGARPRCSRTAAVVAPQAPAAPRPARAWRPRWQQAGRSAMAKMMQVMHSKTAWGYVRRPVPRMRPMQTLRCVLGGGASAVLDWCGRIRLGAWNHWRTRARERANVCGRWWRGRVKRAGTATRTAAGFSSYVQLAPCFGQLPWPLPSPAPLSLRSLGCMRGCRRSFVRSLVRPFTRSFVRQSLRCLVFGLVPARPLFHS